MKLKQSRPDVYAYENFRKFLNEVYHSRKLEDSSYSFKRFADQAGLGSPNYLKLVMDGDRTLTISNIHRFAFALELSYEETQYFEALVLLTQAETPREKTYYQAKLGGLRRSHRSTTVRKSSTTALLDEPSTTAVVVCLHGAEVQSAAAQAGAKTGVKKERVARIIETLMKEELMTAVNGRFELTEKYIQFQDRKSKSGSQKKYIRAQLDSSIKALETRYARDAKFYCNTFTIAENSLEILQDKVATWIDDLMEQTNAEVPERVIQLNVQLFPYTS